MDFLLSVLELEHILSRGPRTATVRSHGVPVQLLYGPVPVHCTLRSSPSIGAGQQRKMHGKVARRTVAVRGDRGTVQQLYRDTDDCKNKSRPVEANSIVV